MLFTLRRLQPDLIVTQALCAVCAVSYDDVRAIIEKNGDAQVYFGEALAYERGAGIALWRVRAQGFGWLQDLYDWWVEMERTEPIGLAGLSEPVVLKPFGFPSRRPTSSDTASVASRAGHTWPWPRLR